MMGTGLCACSLSGEDSSILGDDRTALHLLWLLPDEPDLDEDARAEMLAKIKAAVHDISGNFQGSEQFTRPIDTMVSVDQIMGFVLPFMPVDVDKKQLLLETVSVRERYAAFLQLLTGLNESINLRIEVARKASEKVGKANREAMLREQPG